MAANVSMQVPVPPRGIRQAHPVVTLPQRYDISTAMNPWESCALQYRYPDEPPRREHKQTMARRRPAAPAMDPIIYPGLYAPSGFDMMNILLSVISRPEPKISLGPIDCSVALLLCDLSQPDIPIVYASEAFSHLTGYSKSEIVGKNCRFLQAPGGQVQAASSRQHVNKELISQMRTAIQVNDELQINVVNFKKDGTRFENLLTMIPVRWNSTDFRYCVGFQVELD